MASSMAVPIRPKKNHRRVGRTTEWSSGSLTRRTRRRPRSPRLYSVLFLFVHAWNITWWIVKYKMTQSFWEHAARTLRRAWRRSFLGACDRAITSSVTQPTARTHSKASGRQSAARRQSRSCATHSMEADKRATEFVDGTTEPIAPLVVCAASNGS